MTHHARLILRSLDNIFAQTGFEPQSSYLCFPSTWDHRCEPPCLAQVALTSPHGCPNELKVLKGACVTLTSVLPLPDPFWSQELPFSYSCLPHPVYLPPCEFTCKPCSGTAPCLRLFAAGRSQQSYLRCSPCCPGLLAAACSAVDHTAAQGAFKSINQIMSLRFQA
jgi:hypothetical protein